MTWEQFELTGKIEDYLLYKGIDVKDKLNVQAKQGDAGLRGDGDNGTDDNGDRHGSGRTSIR